MATIANSRVLDISDIDDLVDGVDSIDWLEYPTGEDPPNKRNFNVIDDETIEIDTTLTPDAGGSGTLTGIVTFTNGSAAITGSGTAFTSELTEGYHIKKSTGTRWYRIYSIESDTALTLAEPCRETTGADSSGASQYCYETVYLFCKKAHTLTATESTLARVLEKLLIFGVCGKAAIAKARDLIGKVNIGGATTPRQLQNWGTTQYGLFRSGLAELEQPDMYIEYPKD